jgi:hypothetical protein
VNDVAEIAIDINLMPEISQSSVKCPTLKMVHSDAQFANFTFFVGLANPRG